MKDRGITIALAIAVVVLATMLVMKSTPKADAPVVPEAGLAIDAGAPAVDAAIDDTPQPLATGGATDGGFRLADGTPVPPLGAHAPSKVRFGVVLVQYAGAEGAPHKARSRDDALALAVKLADDAKTDFHGAVTRGDDGSADDVGAVTRGMLEPASEAVLFGLAAGATSGVLDTPRGFWIVKRIE
jgi:hypothetical protein